MNFIIQREIQLEHKKDAAQLYALAFQNKFKRILGDTEAVTELMKNSINRHNAISAVSSDNELLGISGFHLNKTSLVGLKLKDFTKHFGFSRGCFKYVILAILFYRKPDTKTQLLMDGIAVKEDNRGQGIGKLLFSELEQFARDKNLSSIKLDVIDENPKAKKLYKRIGFVCTKHHKLPLFIFKLIGVSGVTTMVKKL